MKHNIKMSSILMQFQNRDYLFLSLLSWGMGGGGVGGGEQEIFPQYSCLLIYKNIIITNLRKI